MSDYPSPTRCPSCHHTESTTVCSRCKTDKLQDIEYRYQAERALRNMSYAMGQHINRDVGPHKPPVIVHRIVHPAEIDAVVMGHITHKKDVHAVLSRQIRLYQARRWHE